MGLDIVAYSRLVAAPEGIDPETGEEAIKIYANPDFPGRHEPLCDRAVYVSEGESTSFTAGSYGGYSAWRDQLARLAGYGSAEGAWTSDSGPFWELINFSDCEGDIGSVAAAKLAQDFVQFEEQAKTLEFSHPEDREYFYQKYQEWRRACELAADRGVVRFF